MCREPARLHAQPRPGQAMAPLGPAAPVYLSTCCGTARLLMCFVLAGSRGVRHGQRSPASYSLHQYSFDTVYL